MGGQRELPGQLGIQGPTLTHHSDAMEAQGLLTRRRDPADRRAHVVELTPAGGVAFDRLRTAALAFDRRLRAGLSEAETAGLRSLLVRLRDAAREPAGPETAPNPDPLAPRSVSDSAE